MASKFPRLAVTRDPELHRALELTRGLLGGDETRSAAAQVRALALRGARSVLQGSGPEAELRRRLFDEYGTIPARVDPRSLGAVAGEPDPDNPAPASEALRWVRGK